MTNRSKPTKPTVELRPSRIRRDPVQVAKPADSGKDLWWRSNEWEIKLALIGIVAFALAINVIVVAVSAYTN